MTWDKCFKHNVDFDDECGECVRESRAASAQSAEVERLSKRIEALQAIIRKGYASFDLQQIRKSLVAIEGMALYFYDDPSETKRSEYLSEALRCRLMIKDYGKDENLDLAARAEAAEIKLSQLQQQFDAGRYTGEQDCIKALKALSAVRYATPAEGYGSNSSWAIADMCRAIKELSEKVERGGQQ